LVLCTLIKSENAAEFIEHVENLSEDSQYMLQQVFERALQIVDGDGGDYVPTHIPNAYNA
jgi:myosin heavy subunit